MYRLAIISILLVSAFADPIPELPEIAVRIVGGENTTIEEAPYQVLMQMNGGIFCGGVILSRDLILTAAHCIKGESRQYMKILAGSTDARKGGSLHQVAFVFVHKNYTKNADGVPSDDIAILKLRKPMKLDHTRKVIPLFAADAEAKPGTMGVVSGWGTLTSKGSASSILQMVTVPIISKTECDKAYKALGGLPTGQICTSTKDMKDSCGGDSGGPLVINGTLAGIVSWGKGCAEPEHPGVYTEVAHYRGWIQSISDEANDLVIWL